MSLNTTSNSTSRSSSKSPKKSTHEDFKAASAAVELEYNAVQRLKRLSIGNSLNFDPDLPVSTSASDYVNSITNNDSGNNSAKNKLQNSINSHLKRSKSKLSTHSVTYEDSENYGMSLETDDEISFSDASYNAAVDNTNITSNSDGLIDSINNTFDYSDDDEIEFNDEDVDFVDLDPNSFGDDDGDESNVIWVPATAHPKISPENFRNHIQSAVAQVNSKIQRSGSLNRESSLRKVNVTLDDEEEEDDDDHDKPKKTTDNIDGESGKPSLRELTKQLETLSKRAGLDDDDAVTLARSLSTRSIGITKIEKEAYSKNDSDENVTQTNDLNRTRTKRRILKNKLNKTRESLFIKDDDFNDINNDTADDLNSDTLVQMDHNIERTNHSDFVSNLTTNGWTNYRRQKNLNDSNNSLSPSPRRVLPSLPENLQLDGKRKNLQNHTHVYKDIRKIHNAQRPLGKPHLEPIKLKTPSSRLPDVPQQQQQQQQQSSLSSSPSHSPTTPSTPAFSTNQNFPRHAYPVQYQHNQQPHQHQIPPRTLPKQNSNQNLFQLSQQQNQQQYFHQSVSHEPYHQQRQKITHQQPQHKQQRQQQNQNHQEILHQQLQQQHYQQTQQQLQKKRQQNTYDQHFNYDDRKLPVSQTITNPNNIDNRKPNVHSPTDVQDKNKLFVNQNLLNVQARNKSSKEIHLANSSNKNNVENSNSSRSNLALPVEQNISNDSIKVDTKNNEELEPEIRLDLPKRDISKDNEIPKEKDSKSKGKSSFSSFFKIKRDKPRNVSNSSINTELNEEPKSTFKTKRSQSQSSESGMSSPKADFIAFFGGKKDKDKNKEKDKYKSKGKETQKETKIVKKHHSVEITEDNEVNNTKKSHDVATSSPKLGMGLFSLNKSSESLTDKKEKHELKRSTLVQTNKSKNFSSEIKVSPNNNDNESLSINKAVTSYKDAPSDHISLNNNISNKAVSISNSSLTSSPSSSISNSKGQTSSTHTSPISHVSNEPIEPVDKVDLSTSTSLASSVESTSTVKQTADSIKVENSSESKTEIPDSDSASTELIKQSLRETLKQNERPSKPNQPLEMTDSAFGFPLPPVSKSTLLMLDHRFPVHVERAIYRLSHLKLADPKRPLRQQVLLSNFMYSYLNLVNHTLWIQSKEQGSSNESTDQLATDGNTGLIAASTVA